MNEAIKLAAKLMTVTDFSVSIDNHGAWQAEVHGIAKDGEDKGYSIDYTGFGRTMNYAIADLKRYMKHKIKTGKDLPGR